MAKEIKFCYAHFPVGTIFEIGESLSFLKKHGGSGTFEVTGIVRNGPDSYILKTTHYNEYETPVTDENFHPTGEMRTERLDTSINIDHVKRIIKRGSGPVLVEKDGFKWLQCRYGAVPKGRNSYASYYGMEHLVRYLSTDMAPETASIDLDGLYQYLLKHASFSKHYEAIIDGYSGRDVGRTRLQIRKKKLKKAIKQNINRFLKSPAKTQKAWDDAMAEDYENDWNDSYDREHSLGKYSRGEADLDSGYDDTYYGSALDERLPLLAGNNSREDVDEQDFLTDRVEIVQEETHV